VTFSAVAVKFLVFATYYVVVTFVATTLAHGCSVAMVTAYIKSAWINGPAFYLVS